MKTDTNKNYRLTSEESEKFFDDVNLMTTLTSDLYECYLEGKKLKVNINKEIGNGFDKWEVKLTTKKYE